MELNLGIISNKSSSEIDTYLNLSYFKTLFKVDIILTEKLILHKFENAFTLDNKSWGYRRDMEVMSFAELLKIVVTTVCFGGKYNRHRILLPEIVVAVSGDTQLPVSTFGHWLLPVVWCFCFRVIRDIQNEIDVFGSVSVINSSHKNIPGVKKSFPFGMSARYSMWDTGD